MTKAVVKCMKPHLRVYVMRCRRRKLCRGNMAFADGGAKFSDEVQYHYVPKFTIVYSFVLSLSSFIMT